MSKHTTYIFFLISTSFIYILISKYTIQPPVYIAYSSNDLLTNSKNITISGNLADILIQGAFNKNLPYYNCVITLSINQLKVSIAKTLCYISLWRYFFSRGNENTQYSGSHKQNTNTIEFQDVRFSYSIEGDTIFVNTTKTDIINSNSELIFCTKLNLFHILTTLIGNPGIEQYFTKRYLPSIKPAGRTESTAPSATCHLCIYTNTKELNIYFTSNNRTTKVMFNKIIKIYSNYIKTTIKKINQNKYYIDLTQEVGTLLFLEHFKNCITIRFSYNLNDENTYRKIKKGLKQTTKHNYLLLNNIPLNKLIEYISTFIQLDKINLKKIKLQYKIYGILRW